MNETIKTTPIYAALQSQGVKFTQVAGWQLPDVYEVGVTGRAAVALADQSANGLVSVQGAEAESVVASVLDVNGLEIGQGAESGDSQVYRLRQDMFLVSTPPGGEVSAAEKLNDVAGKALSLVTVNDVTNGRFQFHLIGPKSADLLSRISGVDFHDSQFPNLSVKQTGVAKTRQTILRHDVAGNRVYCLIGAASFGEYVWETIQEAGRPLGLALIGHTALTDMMSG
jgi:heterotetrameric sarcosine oxidase gamma subunit